MILNPHCGGHLKNRRMNYKNKINCSIDYRYKGSLIPIYYKYIPGNNFGI